MARRRLRADIQTYSMWILLILWISSASHVYGSNERRSQGKLFVAWEEGRSWRVPQKEKVIKSRVESHVTA